MHITILATSPNYGMRNRLKYVKIAEYSRARRSTRTWKVFTVIDDNLLLEKMLYSKKLFNVKIYKKIPHSEKL